MQKIQQDKYTSETTVMNANQDKDKKPFDYNEKVNTGIKSDDDGMYHWSQGRDNSDFLGMGYGMYDDEEKLVSLSSEMSNLTEREMITVADLDKPGSFVVVARGGRGMSTRMVHMVFMIALFLKLITEQFVHFIFFFSLVNTTRWSRELDVRQEIIFTSFNCKSSSKVCWNTR